VELDARLPSSFTPTGERPTGPAWYQTHTVAYAQELGYNVAPIEAYLRCETGAYLDPWHDRLKTAYIDTLADLCARGDAQLVCGRPCGQRPQVGAAPRGEGAPHMRAA
jgi:hypothetical protein